MMAALQSDYFSRQLLQLLACLCLRGKRQHPKTFTFFFFLPGVTAEVCSMRQICVTPIKQKYVITRGNLSGDDKYWIWS